MAQLNFKASSIQIEERTPKSYEPLPAGDYEMMIVASENKATKAGNGHYLELEMHVIGGAHSGRRHWERLNLDNPNHQAVKIAQESLARLCAALGVDDVNDSSELHDRAFIAEIGIDKKDATRNVIWNYRSLADEAPDFKPTAKIAAPAKPATSAANKAARPWG